MNSILRRFAFICLLVTLSISATAEWLTFQVPLGFNNHTLSLWEMSGSGPPPFLPLESSSNHPSFQVTLPQDTELVGGMFNGDGEWLPDANSYVRLQVERKVPGAPFWLKDETMDRFAPLGQTALALATWQNPNLSSDMQLFTMRTASYQRRNEHQLIFHYNDGNGTPVLTLLTAGPEQIEYAPTGEAQGLGFFEVWGPLLPTGATNGKIIDQTTNEVTVGTLQPNLLDITWEQFEGTLPTSQVIFFLGTNDTSQDSFVLTVEGVGNSTLPCTNWTYDDPVNGHIAGYAVIGEVGYGYNFWLSRARDGAQTPAYRMLDASQELDVRGIFPAAGQGWTTKYFTIASPPYYPGQMGVRHSDGTFSPLGTITTAALDVWDDSGNPVYSHDLVYVEAQVDLSQPWWMVTETSSGGELNLGHGPSFLPYQSAPHPNAPADWVSNWIPLVRQGHGLRLHQTTEWNVTQLSSNQTFEVYYPVNGAYELFSWDAFAATAPLDNTVDHYSLIDPAVGDALTGLTGNSPSTEFWFPSQTLILKISVTRWSHDLVVRTPIGQFPINKHNTQGDWSLSSTGQAWFNPYGYFDATSTAYQSLSWWIVDLGEPGSGASEEILSADAGSATNFIDAIDNTDSDQDGWANWYERLMGTDPYKKDSDGDGDWDSVDANPRARSASSAGSTLKVYTHLD